MSANSARHEQEASWCAARAADVMTYTAASKTQFFLVLIVSSIQFNSIKVFFKVA